MNESLPTVRFPLHPGASNVLAHGRLMARGAMASLVPAVARIVSEAIVLIDYSTVAAATSSYVERSYVWAMNCARLAAGEDERDLPALQDAEDAITPLAIYPIAIGCTADVVNEFEAASLKTRSLVLVAPDAGRPLLLRVIGEFDRALRETLDLLCGTPGASASDLHELTNRRGVSGTRNINVNVWNNRLSDLHRLRLARREKDGRVWRYAAIPEGVVYG